MNTITIQERHEIIRLSYLADDRPWAVAFSGGKDSSAVLQMIWNSLSALPRANRQKTVNVCFVDTGMDHPLYRDEVTSTLDQIAAAALDQRMPIAVRVLQPELRHRFFVAVIGRGYAPPTHWFRWCTKGMRIRPMSVFIRQQLSTAGEVVVALGIRRDESPARSQTLEKYALGTPFFGQYGSLRGATAFTPIEDFTVGDVWQMLMQSNCPWGGRNRRLARLYSIASGGECPSYSLGDAMAKSCGGSRFGCWTCTVVRQDKSGVALADDDPQYEGMVQFREWLSVMRYDYERRWKCRRNRKPGPGPLRLDTRKEVLERLIGVETALGRELLTKLEVNAIQDFWTADGDRKQTAIEMYVNHQRDRSPVTR